MTCFLARLLLLDGSADLFVVALGADFFNRFVFVPTLLEVGRFALVVPVLLTFLVAILDLAFSLDLIMVVNFGSTCVGTNA